MKQSVTTWHFGQKYHDDRVVSLRDFLQDIINCKNEILQVIPTKYANNSIGTNQLTVATIIYKEITTP